MLLKKRTDTRGVGISNMRKSIYLLTTTPTSHTHTFHPLSTIVIHTFNLCKVQSTVHPESFRSNAQIAIGFACRNRPRVHRNDEFAYVYLRSHAFPFAFVCDYCSQSTVRACVREYVRVFFFMVVKKMRNKVLYNTVFLYIYIYNKD